jgi:methionyl-tRNA formyltransferase
VETGVTLMQTDKGLDTGPIVAQARCTIQPDDTAETLTQRLAHLGADLLIETLPRWLSDQIVPRPQPQAGVTLAPRLRKQDGRIDWSQSAVHIDRMIRAYTPWPGSYTVHRGRSLKILRAQPLHEWRGSLPPGQVLSLPDKRIAVATGQGALVLDHIQLAGKRAMPADAFCCGDRDFVGARLGEL